MCRNVSPTGHEVRTTTLVGAAKRTNGGIAAIQSGAHAYYAVHRCGSARS